MARKHAIVIGASMAGLMATRALSDHFERVTVIERDFRWFFEGGCLAEVESGMDALAASRPG